MNRDWAKDLALCEAATPGPWVNGYCVQRDYEHQCEQWDGSCYVADRHDYQSPEASYIGTIGYGGVGERDAEFIAAARTGWPHAIRRAMTAEDWQRRAVEVLRRCCVSSRRGTICVICGKPIKDLENPVHSPDCALSALLREVQK